MPITYIEINTINATNIYVVDVCTKRKFYRKKHGKRNEKTQNSIQIPPFRLCEPFTLSQSIPRSFIALQ